MANYCCSNYTSTQYWYESLNIEAFAFFTIGICVPLYNTKLIKETVFLKYQALSSTWLRFLQRILRRTDFHLYMDALPQLFYDYPDRRKTWGSRISITSSCQRLVWRSLVHHPIWHGIFWCVTLVSVVDSAANGIGGVPPLYRSMLVYILNILCLDSPGQLAQAPIALSIGVDIFYLIGTRNCNARMKWYACQDPQQFSYIVTTVSTMGNQYRFVLNMFSLKSLFFQIWKGKSIMKNVS